MANREVNATIIDSMEENSALTLTQVAHYGRLGVKISLITLVVLIVGRVFLEAFFAYWNAAYPPPPPPPTVGFGLLPPLRFPIKTDADKPASYQLQTANGSFPDFGDRARVYFMPKSNASLLADQRAKQIASGYGFVFAPSPLDTRTYRWTKSSPLQATLQMDIQNLTFTLTTDYLSHPELLVQKDLPDQSHAESLVKSFIASGQNVPSDISTVSAQISYLKSAGNDVAPAVSFSDADFVQVDLTRTPIDNQIPFYTQAGRRGIVHAILVSNGNNITGRDQIVQMEDYYHPIDYTEVQTYPIRPPAQAWQTLQGGEGYIVNKGTNPTATVRTVSLGYYDDTQEQQYMQPVYVFEGDGGFMGFVPAVDPRYIQSLQQSTQQSRH